LSGPLFPLRSSCFNTSISSYFLNARYRLCSSQVMVPFDLVSTKSFISSTYFVPSCNERKIHKVNCPFLYVSSQEDKSSVNFNSFFILNNMYYTNCIVQM